MQKRKKSEIAQEGVRHGIELLCRDPGYRSSSTNPHGLNNEQDFLLYYQTSKLYYFSNITIIQLTTWITAFKKWVI